MEPGSGRSSGRSHEFVYLLLQPLPLWRERPLSLQVAVLLGMPQPAINAPQLELKEIKSQDVFAHMGLIGSHDHVLDQRSEHWIVVRQLCERIGPVTYEVVAHAPERPGREVVVLQPADVLVSEL
jgi:hypothetical protein